MSNNNSIEVVEIPPYQDLLDLMKQKLPGSPYASGNWEISYLASLIHKIAGIKMPALDFYIYWKRTYQYQTFGSSTRRILPPFDDPRVKALGEWAIKTLFEGQESAINQATDYLQIKYSLLEAIVESDS